MTTLKERLGRIRESFSKQAPDAAKAIMHRSTADLQASGILDLVPKAGSPLQHFELPDDQGQMVRSEDLLAKGPLVVTVYRGVW